MEIQHALGFCRKIEGDSPHECHGNTRTETYLFDHSRFIRSAHRTAFLYKTGAHSCSALLFSPAHRIILPGLRRHPGMDCPAAWASSPLPGLPPCSPVRYIRISGLRSQQPAGTAAPYAPYAIRYGISKYLSLCSRDFDFRKLDIKKYPALCVSHCHVKPFSLLRQPKSVMHSINGPVCIGIFDENGYPDF